MPREVSCGEPERVCAQAFETFMAPITDKLARLASVGPVRNEEIMVRCLCDPLAAAFEPRFVLV